MTGKPCLCLLMMAGSAAAQLPSDDTIRGILKQRVDDYHQSVGIVVGMIDQNGRKVVSYGALEKGDSRPLNGDTVFEIGSVTKVFTSLLLSDMVKRGEVALTDPVVKYLPAGTKVPERNGRQITLENLSTHTSGLPRIPSNMKMTDPANLMQITLRRRCSNSLLPTNCRAILDRSTSIRISEADCSDMRWHCGRARITARW